MNLKQILCPIDFSEFNAAANDYASMLATPNKSLITYLHAFLPNVNSTPPEFFDAEKETRRLQNKLEEFIQPTQENIACKHVVRFGQPVSCINDYIDENSIDIVVIGTHGHTGLKRVLMGSVAESIVRQANCPVLAVKSNPTTE